MIELAPTTYTIEMWIKMTSWKNVNSGLVDKMVTDQTQGFKLTVENDTVKYYVATESGPPVIAMHHRKVRDSMWHHIAGVTDLVKATVYVDGEAGKQAFVPRESGGAIGLWSIAEEITFGVDNEIDVTSRLFGGFITEVRLLLLQCFDNLRLCMRLWF
jgi:hypothetical protein